MCQKIIGLARTTGFHRDHATSNPNRSVAPLNSAKLPTPMVWREVVILSSAFPVPDRATKSKCVNQFDLHFLKISCLSCLSPQSRTIAPSTKSNPLIWMTSKGQLPLSGCPVLGEHTASVPDHSISYSKVEKRVEFFKGKTGTEDLTGQLNQVLNMRIHSPSSTSVIDRYPGGAAIFH